MTPARRRLRVAAATAATLAAAPWAAAQGEPEQGGYNLKFGELRFDLTADAGVTYDDNINVSGIEPLDDIILKAGVNFNGVLPITEDNLFRMRFGLGVTRYLENSERNRLRNVLNFEDGSEFGLDAKVGPALVRVYDSFSLSSDPTDAVDVDRMTVTPKFDILSYSRFNNAAGVRATFDLDLSRLDLGLSRQDLIALGDEVQVADRTRYDLTGAFSRQLSKSVRAGLQGSVFTNTYAEDFQNDSDGVSYGPILSWQLTDFLGLDLSVTRLLQSFDSSGANLDSSDVESNNFSASLRHTPNANFTHSLTVAETTSLGFLSNSRTVETVSYAFSWSGIRNIGFGGGVRLESGGDSGGLAAEDFERFGFQLRASLSSSPRSRWSLSYDYQDKTSDVSQRAYDRSQVGLSYSLDF